MRNVDKIKGLEKELGRYRKKIVDQQKEIDRLMEGIALAESGSMETNMLVDAIMAQTALKYGEPVEDEDTGERIGYRVTLPMFSVSETLKKYEVRTRRNNAAKEYVVGVMLRGQEE